MRNISINGYRRVSKHAARKLYEKGEPVLFCPVNLIPGGMWDHGCIITKEEGRTFEQVLNSFEYYNCIDSSTGYYTAFYVKE